MSSKLSPPFDVEPIAPHDTVWDREMRSKRDRRDADGLNLMLSDAKQGRLIASTGMSKLEFERRIATLQQAIKFFTHKR